LLWGYATSATDDGHESNSVIDASWAIGHPEKLIDFGYRAVHVTAVLSKKITEAYYGKSAAEDLLLRMFGWRPRGPHGS
jgi:hypothetical protein